MKKDDFLKKGEYQSPAMEMIELETENSFASGMEAENAGTNIAGGQVAPLADDFSDLLDF